jgi:SAM-dependent methyltransferase
MRLPSSKAPSKPSDGSSASKIREAEVYRGTARIALAPNKSALIRLFTDAGYAARVVRYALGLPVPMNTEDRRVLEQVIFPHFLRLPDMHRILFVGCDWYTKHYQRMFFRRRDYWTIDVAAQSRKFGARQHILGALQDLDKHFAPGFFDLIFCNGVYGFGLDAAADIERAIEMCWSRLRENGCFVFGWDDIPARTPVPLDDIAALRRFRPLEFPDFKSSRYVTDTPYRHTYDFYTKGSA